MTDSSRSHTVAPLPGDLPRVAESVQQSAQQIWLAGLGAFAKAQEEGGRMFKTLVQEGLALQRSTQSAAQAHLDEAAQRMGTLASGLGMRAAGPWDRLEGIFEERVAKALQRLGVPTADEVQALRERIETLEKASPRAAGRSAAPARRRTSASDND
jgi:poly(hydroxyalkanoate) granule-associated protein